MFTTRGNEWIACLTIAAVLELYTAFRIPPEILVVNFGLAGVFARQFLDAGEFLAVKRCYFKS